MTYLIVFFGLFCSLPAGAQSLEDSGTSRVQLDKPDRASEPRARLAFKPQFGVTNMRILDEGGNFEADPGISVGSFAELGNGLVTFETGLLFNQMGGKTRSDGIDWKYVLNYLSIPLAAKVNFSRDANRTFYTKAGIVPSLLMTKQAKTTIGGRSIATHNFMMNNFDTLAEVGFGGTLPLRALQGTNTLSLEATYLRGLINLSQGPTKEYNEGFMLGMIYSLDVL